MMSRHLLLVFLLVVLIITSQFEWKQQLVNEIEASPTTSQKPKHGLNREELIKGKIILSQEKNIQRLHKLVQSLQLQLLQCRGENNATDDTRSSSTLTVNDIEKQPVVEDTLFL